MGRSNPAPSRTATPQQLAQHARRLAEAADREASRLARAAPSDMPHAQTFFRSRHYRQVTDRTTCRLPRRCLAAPVAANAAQDVVPETQALTGGDAAGLFAAVAPGATGGTADAAAGLFAAVAPGATGGTAGDAAAGLIAADAPGATGGTGGDAPAGGAGAGAALSSQRGSFNWQTPELLAAAGAMWEANEEKQISKREDREKKVVDVYKAWVVAISDSGAGCAICAWCV
ncbi:hypothetical protein RI054_11g56870 [Pseudoscourfieldia marina]